MPRKMILIGGAIFGASVLLVLILLMANGGANKSAQFTVLGELVSGVHGAAMRVLIFAAVAGVLIGAVTAFSGVSRNDAARRKKS